VGNNDGPGWGIIMTLIAKKWGIVMTPDWGIMVNLK
jgi:hypothetical protein